MNEHSMLLKFPLFRQSIEYTLSDAELEVMKAQKRANIEGFCREIAALRLEAAREDARHERHYRHQECALWAGICEQLDRIDALDFIVQDRVA